MEHNSLKLNIEVDALVQALLSLDSSKRLSLLDSCGVSGARFLIAGFDPVEIIEVCGRRARISRRDSDQLITVESDALTLLDERLAGYRATPTVEDPYPSSACIATLAYELFHQFEPIKTTGTSPRKRTEPDAVFAFYDTLFVHDYELDETRIVGSHCNEQMMEIENAIRLVHSNSSLSRAPRSQVNSNLTRDEYLEAVLKIKEHIAVGDIYQANLTQRFSCALPAVSLPEDVFLRLRRDHPAPFAAFIRRREDSVISISPESFLNVDASVRPRKIKARPIKGTRQRGKNEVDDARMRAELLASEKDRAENIMIVDLLRNDLGRVCSYGTVGVTELCKLEEHPTLFHLVSTVGGTLREEVTAGDLIRACFPCGSITGAPKIRAMEIIDEVETVPRGLSMGAIGYFGFDGAIDLSVAIRTMTVKDDLAEFNVGGGVVADSDPAEEYEESMLKARALFDALGVDHSENVKSA